MCAVRPKPGLWAADAQAARRGGLGCWFLRKGPMDWARGPTINPLELLDIEPLPASQRTSLPAFKPLGFPAAKAPAPFLQPPPHLLWLLPLSFSSYRFE